LEWSEPETATKYFKYSNRGELLEVQWNDTTTNTDHRLVSKYDALGRVTYRDERNNGVTDPDTINEYLYDMGASVAPQVTPTYVLGRLAQVQAPTGKVYFSYDSFGRMNARTFTDMNANMYVEKSTFRGDGALSTLEFYLPDTAFNRELVEYAYDTAGKVREIKFSDGSVDSKLYEAFDIDPLGRVRKATFGGGTHYQANGRFLSRDPLVVPRTAATTNAYAFAMNDPLNRSDPSGMQCIGQECQGEGPTNPDPGGPSGINPPGLYLPSGGRGGPSNPRAADRPPPNVLMITIPAGSGLDLSGLKNPFYDPDLAFCDSPGMGGGLAAYDPPKTHMDGSTSYPSPRSWRKARSRRSMAWCGGGPAI